MSVATRTATRIQDQDDAPSLGAGQDGYALTWDNASGAFVATALFTGGLLATGATTGATAQAQAFTNGVVTGAIKPAADSTTALQLQTAAGAAIVTVDTTNQNVGFGVVPSALARLSLNFSQTGAGSINAQTFFVQKVDATGTVYVTGTGSLAKNLASGANSAVTVAIGVSGGCEVSAAAGRNASISYAMALSAATPGLNGVGTKSISGAYGVYIYNQGATGVTNAYGVFVSAISGAVNNYALVTDGGAVVFNEAGTDSDFRVEGDTDVNLVFVDAGNDRVGVGTASPATKLHGLLTSAATNVVTNVVTIGHDTSGTAAAGFGAGLLYQLESSTTVAQNAARIQALWYEATHATLKADLIGTAFDAGGEREGWRVRGDGSGPALGFYGVTPIARATLATGAGASVDDVITALQNLGLVKQS